VDIRPAPTMGTQVSRWRTTKGAATGTMGVSSIGVSAAQTATGQTTVALATGTAAASATGIGLVVAAGALLVGTSVLSARSAHKSRIHRNNLNKIYERRAAYACGPIQSGDEVNRFHHDVVANEVLPYIVSKKSAKFHRKVVGAVPIVGSAETARSAVKSLYKRARGTKGQNRRNGAHWLGHHLITHNCGLSQAIVADLYSFEEMLWLQSLKLSELIPLLMDKMKST
jgi:hypothetical protein